jgi:hypothetical protein
MRFRIIHWKTPVHQAGLQDAMPMQVYICLSLSNAKNSDSSIPKPVTKIMVLIWLSSQQQQSCQKNTFSSENLLNLAFWRCFLVINLYIPALESWRPAWWTGVYECMIQPYFQIWQPCLFLIPGHIKCNNNFEAHSTQFDCYVQYNAPNSDCSIPNLLSKFYQNCNLI